jgi:hypothetical protein
VLVVQETLAGADLAVDPDPEINVRFQFCREGKAILARAGQRGMQRQGGGGGPLEKAAERIVAANGGSPGSRNSCNRGCARLYVKLDYVNRGTAHDPRAARRAVRRSHTEDRGEGVPSCKQGY